MDRIGAALKALRQTHTQRAGDTTSLGVKCLRVVVSQLADEGISTADLQPLIDLDNHFNGPEETDAKSPAIPRDRRHNSAPSATLLARAAVVIDLLVKSGQDESEAAQAVMRRLIAAGIPPPAQGGDARGWKRLLEWRNAMQQGVGPEDAKYEYKAFTTEIDAIPAVERVKRVLDERLWDRRR